MPTFDLRQCLGAIETVPVTLIPDGFAVAATNVELSAFGAMRPRVGTTKMTLTSGPSAEIDDLFTERTAAADILWAFSGFHTSAYAAHRYNGSSWSSVTLTDSPAYNGLTETNVSCAAYNGKVFLAYNSAENRLHLYDGTSVRRVGIVASAAATVANTGAGAYPATIRYYKIQFRIFDGSSITQVASELSPSVSFTPSGAGTAARITKPTTPDGANVWVVYASPDDVTYYYLTAIVVGTTTYDDTTVPSAYNTFGLGVAPEVGLYVPPPSCKYLATNGERLFMAGAYETSASSGQTTPSARRVWFTRPLGATDGGDDEAITTTEDLKNWLDIDSDDGSPITAMVSTFDGAIYVFTKTSVWQLSDTGNVEAPIRADRVASGVGVATGKLVTADTTAQDGMLYFSSATGPYRYSASTGLQYLGADVYTHVTTAGSLQKWSILAVGFDPATRRVYWLYGDDNSSHYSRSRVLDPSLMQSITGEWRGGWSRDDWSASYSRLRAVSVYQNKLHIGGADSGAVIFARDVTVSTDDSVAYTAAMTSRTHVLGDGTVNFRTEEPYIWKPKGLAVTVAYAVNYGGNSFTFSDTAATESVGSEAVYHRQKIEGLVAADAFCLSTTLTVTSPVVTADRHMDGVERLLIPVIPMERG